METTSPSTSLGIRWVGIDNGLFPVAILRSLDGSLIPVGVGEDDDDAVLTLAEHIVRPSTSS